MNENMLSDEQLAQMAQMNQEGQAQMGQPPINQDAALSEAQQLLGIKGLEGTINELKDNLTYKDNLADVISNHPEITKDVLESELSKLQGTNPDLAREFKRSKEGLNMFANGLKSSIKPEGKSDPITEDTGEAQAKQSESLDRLRSGKGSKIDLGAVLGEI